MSWAKEKPNTGAGAGSAEGTYAGHENAEGMVPILALNQQLELILQGRAGR